MLDFALASTHHVALLLMITALAAEAAFMRQTPSQESLRALGRLDLIYGLSAGVLLLAGGARLSMGAKGIEFYSSNPVFWIKLAAFVVVGLISIIPTVRFIRWRRNLSSLSLIAGSAAWMQTRKLVMLQLHLIIAIAVIAAAMARGIGL